MAPTKTLSAPERALARKIRLSSAALVFERMWPRLWLALGVIALFILVSLLGLWSTLSPLTHRLVLGGFAVATLAAIVWMVLVRRPTRDEALRRIEMRSNVAHRPASSYEDTLATAQSTDPSTQAIWQAHKQRLARQIDGLKVGAPKPRTDRYDPIALRAALALMVVVGLALVGDSARDRLASAFFSGTPSVGVATGRLDAWVTPPTYTSKPPIILVDGNEPGRKPTALGADGSLEVPQRSQLIVRSSGGDAAGVWVEIVPTTGARQTVKPEASESKELSEVTVGLMETGTVNIHEGSRKIATFAFLVTPDLPPKIALLRDPERTLRGSMKLTYTMEDDYGVASAVAKFSRIPDEGADPLTAWARNPKLKGPRPPHERPPVLALRLPRPGGKAKDKDKDTPAELWSRHELQNHAWSGAKVRMRLVARDHAGQVGQSEPYDMVMPGRVFRKPIARAVAEQRRHLIADWRTKRQVLRALDTLALEPEDVFRDRTAYLLLRSSYFRIANAKTRVDRKSATDQLYHLAMRLEDGAGASEAEKRLRDLQEQLSKALENGASEEEIKKLMEELRQALAEYLDQLSRQAQNGEPRQRDPNGRTVRRQDLDRMMRDIENMARNGSRDQAQDMLSQLRDLLDNLQSAQPGQGEGQPDEELMQSLNEFGDLIGREQRLLDDTFNEQQRGGQQQGQDGQQGQQGQPRPGPGQQGQGQPGPGQQGQPGQRGQGRQGQGQPGQPGGRQPGPGQQPGPGGRGELGDRQGQLGQMLDRLQRQLGERGLEAPDQLGQAREAMRNAEEALRNGDLDTATREESRALESLRQGGQQMAQKLLERQNSRRMGQGPGSGDVPRDPLGRALNDKTNEGGNVDGDLKVPEQGDGERAREILEELRRRLADPNRPSLELEYLERLLRRF